MLSQAWLTIAQHVFQPALTGRPELSPANWVQGVTTISRKISRSWAPKKWGPTCDRDISNSAIYTTAIYRAYTVICIGIQFDRYMIRIAMHDIHITKEDFHKKQVYFMDIIVEI